MYRKARKLNTGLDLVQFFTTNEFEINCDNYLAAIRSLSPKDYETFLADPHKVDTNDYSISIVNGFKKFFLKEDERDLLRARKQVVL